MKLHEIIIGQILVIAVISGIFLFMNDGINQYNPTVPDQYNATFVRIQSVIGDINKTASDTRDSLTSLSTQSGITDYLGFFFNSAYNTVKLVVKIPLGMMTFVDEGINNIPMGGYDSLLKTYLYVAIIVFVFIGILMHAIIKSDRI